MASASAPSAPLRARNATVEQHDTPASEIGESTEHEGLAVKLAAHRCGLVMIAGQAEDRHAERREQPPEVAVAARVVLHQIAGHEQRVRRPIAPARLRKRGRERGQRGDAAQRLALVAVEMRVGKVHEADGAHEKILAKRCAVPQ